MVAEACRTWYRSGMVVPLTLCIVVLAALVGVLTWLLVQSQRRNDALTAQYIASATTYADTATKSAAEIARNQPKYADRMLDAVTRGISEVTTAVTDSMKAVYAPIQQAETQAAAINGDLPTPWYAQEGGMDFTDPTDAFLGGIADPQSDNHQTPGGNLILEDGPAGFGLPADAFD